MSLHSELYELRMDRDRLRGLTPQHHSLDDEEPTEREYTLEQMKTADAMARDWDFREMLDNYGLTMEHYL